MCTLETEWLFRNGDYVTGDSGAGDDDVKDGEQMEEGEGEEVVVALKDENEKEFTVELSSEKDLCYSLPQLYTLKAGNVQCSNMIPRFAFPCSSALYALPRACSVIESFEILQVYTYVWLVTTCG